MPYFKDADEVYAYIGRLFQELRDDKELVGKLKRANTIVQYRHRDPDSQITARILQDEDPRVDLGDSDLEPEVVMTMDADTAHRFWLGKVNPTVALAKGRIKAHGPVEKVLKLVPLVQPAFGRYRQMLEEAGRADLLD